MVNQTASRPSVNNNQTNFQVHQPQAKGDNYNQVQLVELRLRELQAERRKAYQNEKWGEVEEYRLLIDGQQMLLAIAKFDHCFSVLETSHGTETKPFRVQALADISTQLIKHEDNEYFKMDDKKFKLLTKEFLTPVTKDKASKDIFLYSLHSLVLLFIHDRDSYEKYVSAELLPKLRTLIKDAEELESDILSAVINAFTALQFFLCLDTGSLESETQSDIAMLFSFLENSSDEHLNQLTISSLSVLVFYSQDWNDAIESLLPQLVEIYDYKPITTQRKLAQLFAFFYHIYDFSEDFALNNTSSTYQLSIATVDSGDLLHLLHDTLDKFTKELDQPSIDLLKNCISSIKFALLPTDGTEITGTYTDHEQNVMEFDDALALGSKLNKKMTHTSWLRLLALDSVNWALKQFLVEWIELNLLVRTAFQSTSVQSIRYAKRNARNGVPRYAHFRDANYLNWATEDAAVLESEDRSHDRYHRIMAETKRNDKISTKARHAERSAKGDF